MVDDALDQRLVVLVLSHGGVRAQAANALPQNVEVSAQDERVDQGVGVRQLVLQHSTGHDDVLQRGGGPQLQYAVVPVDEGIVELPGRMAAKHGAEIGGARIAAVDNGEDEERVVGACDDQMDFLALLQTGAAQIQLVQDVLGLDQAPQLRVGDGHLDRGAVRIDAHLQRGEKLARREVLYLRYVAAQEAQWQIRGAPHEREHRPREVDVAQQPRLGRPPANELHGSIEVDAAIPGAHLLRQRSGFGQLEEHLGCCLCPSPGAALDLYTIRLHSNGPLTIWISFSGPFFRFFNSVEKFRSQKVL